MRRHVEERPAAGQLRVPEVGGVRTTVSFARPECREATDRARQYFTGYPPSSPAVGILKGGKLVYMMERHQIESRSAEAIANDLVAAFDKHCAPAPVAG